MRQLPPAQIMIVLLLMAALLGLSCGSKQARYYMLSSTPGLSPVTASGGKITVGVGPVTLPDYLIRPEIVTLTGQNEVKMAEFDRWAEPLDETIVRVLVEDLSELLPAARLIGYPWNRTAAIDFRVAVNVAGFEVRPDGRVRLAADWSIRDGEGDLIGSNKTEHYVDVAAKGYAAIVSSMNDALALLSKEIAAGLSR